MVYPKMLRIRQQLSDVREENIPGGTRREMSKLNLASKVKQGESVAISAGSRGVVNINVVLRTLVEEFQSMGAKPFIFPAMGSHGGATAEGQRAVLAHYGVTEESMGCPVRATMEVVQIGASDDGIPVYLDKYAAEADHVVVVNRVKPHTDFKGDIESGLLKMTLIGMGKWHGATIYHRAFVDYSFDRIVRSVSRVVAEKAKLLCGMALVENGYDQTARVVGVLPEELVERERELQEEAKTLMASLPFDEIDVLIVDRMGKDISGTGMDTNIVGRIYNFVTPEPEKPRIKRIFVRDLTDETMGNAIGIGLADVTVKRLVDKMDRKATYINAITGITPEKARLPMYYDTDRESLDAALATIGLTEPEQARIMWISTTLDLTEVAVSEVYHAEVEKREDLEIVGEAQELPFDSAGNLAFLETRAAHVA